MARAGRKRKQGKRTKSGQSAAKLAIGPTNERLQHGEFRTAGLAHVAISPLEDMLKRKIINQDQFTALERYSDVAHKANRSPVKSCIDFTIYGTGEGLPPMQMRAQRELEWLERELGALRDIARAIAVDGVSLGRWAMEKAGAVSVIRERNGRAVEYMEPKRKALKMAQIEIRVAASRLHAAIGA